jgi:hypothetical protein
MTIAVALAAGCGRKEEASRAVELICSYAPSQSAVVGHIASAAGGGAAAASAIANAAGLTAVLHSSGAYIFTGPAGYLAGTLGIAVAEPVLVGVGLLVGGTAVTVEVLCTPTNHPDLVERVQAAVQDFVARAKSDGKDAAKATEPIAKEVKLRVIKTGNQALEYASRKSIEWSEALKQ